MNALILLLAIFQTAPAEAKRPNTADMYCQDVKDLVNLSGSAVLSTGRYTYDRYYGDGAHCPSGTYKVSTYAPTIDQPSCLIGSSCRHGRAGEDGGGSTVIGTSVNCRIYAGKQSEPGVYSTEDLSCDEDHSIWH